MTPAELCSVVCLVALARIEQEAPPAGRSLEDCFREIACNYGEAYRATGSRPTSLCASDRIGGFELDPSVDAERILAFALSTLASDSYSYIEASVLLVLRTWGYQPSPVPDSGRRGELGVYANYLASHAAVASSTDPGPNRALANIRQLVDRTVCEYPGLRHEDALVAMRNDYLRGLVFDPRGTVLLERGQVLVLRTRLGETAIPASEDPVVLLQQELTNLWELRQRFLPQRAAARGGAPRRLPGLPGVAESAAFAWEHALRVLPSLLAPRLLAPPPVVAGGGGRALAAPQIRARAAVAPQHHVQPALGDVRRLARERAAHFNLSYIQMLERAVATLPASDGRGNPASGREEGFVRVSPAEAARPARDELQWCRDSRVFGPALRRPATLLRELVATNVDSGHREDDVLRLILALYTLDAMGGGWTGEVRTYERSRVLDANAGACMEAFLVRELDELQRRPRTRTATPPETASPQGSSRRERCPICSADVLPESLWTHMLGGRLQLGAGAHPDALHACGCSLCISRQRLARCTEGPLAPCGVCGGAVSLGSPAPRGGADAPGWL